MSDAPSPSQLAVDSAVIVAFETQQVPWLQRLVEQPSHTAERRQVEEAASIVDAMAASLSMTTQRHPDVGGAFADHRVYATAAAPPGCRCPLLVGHVDTVFPNSLGFFGFRRDDDIVRGPGVLDMKSGLSVIFFALRAIREAAPSRWQDLAIRVLVNTDEEVGSPSSRPVIEEIAGVTSEALVFEAGRLDDQIVTQRKGGGMFTVTARGRAAHAGNAHAEGVSAIHALALLIPRIEALTDYGRSVTASVGLIEGGTAKNTVPDMARCVIDARFETGADAEALSAALAALVADPFGDAAPIPARLSEARFELGGGVTRPPLEATGATQALRHRYEVHASAVGLMTGEAPRQGGGSDANILGPLGVPVIDGLGPWGRHYHKPEEWSSLSSLQMRTRALARMLLAG